MTRPISVVMAVHNGQAHLDEQISTILADLKEYDELVVVDDASTDPSPALLETWRRKDERIQLIAQDHNLGVRRTFERAIESARHDIIFLSDQDDIWIAGKRDALVSCFDRDPNCLVAISDAEVIDKGGQTTADSFMKRRGGFRPGLFSTLVRSRYLGCAMALDRRLVRLACPVPKGAPMHDMWFGVMASLWGSVAYVDHALIRYRRHGENVTSDRPSDLLQMLRWRAQLSWCVLSRSIQLLLRRRATPSHDALDGGRRS